jgi:hypothetical protein
VTTVTANSFQINNAINLKVVLEVRGRGMSNEHLRKNFTPSDDALIRQQPLTGISLKRLAAILRTNHAGLRQRATELGVSLIIADESHRAIDTRTLRCSNGFVDPLLERLKDIHGKQVI